jgi:hypothetical protein
MIVKIFFSLWSIVSFFMYWRPNINITINKNTPMNYDEIIFNQDIKTKKYILIIKKQNAKSSTGIDDINA